MRGLTSESIERWRTDGYLHLEGHLQGRAVEGLRGHIARVAAMADGECGVLQHYERTSEGVRICRSEHLLEVDDELREIIAGGEILDIASKFLVDPAVIYN